MHALALLLTCVLVATAAGTSASRYHGENMKFRGYVMVIFRKR